jgi:hypothetical protein
MTYEFEKKETVEPAEHQKELENQQILAEEKSRKNYSVPCSGFPFPGSSLLRIYFQNCELLENKGISLNSKKIW